KPNGMAYITKRGFVNEPNSATKITNIPITANTIARAKLAIDSFELFSSPPNVRLYPGYLFDKSENLFRTKLLATREVILSAVCRQNLLDINQPDLRDTSVHQV